MTSVIYHLDFKQKCFKKNRFIVTAQEDICTRIPQKAPKTPPTAMLFKDPWNCLTSFFFHLLYRNVQQLTIVIISIVES